MYTGHIGIALAMRGARQDLSVWLVCFAALMPELIDFAARAGRVDPRLWRHPLPRMLGFGAVFSGLGWLASRSLAIGLLTGLTAVSHVLDDLVTSRLTLWAGGPAAGLHLYLHPVLDFSSRGGGGPRRRVAPGGSDSPQPPSRSWRCFWPCRDSWPPRLSRDKAVEGRRIFRKWPIGAAYLFISRGVHQGGPIRVMRIAHVDDEESVEGLSHRDHRDLRSA